MKRKQFIKSSSMAVAGGMLLPNLACLNKKKEVVSVQPSTPRKNWAGNYTYKAEKLYEPSTAEELQQLVKKLDKQKALGSRHCFNNIADSPKNQISTKKLNKIVALDQESRTITVESGVRYGDFCKELYEKGYALHNLASLPHITVVGACSTATHGSGVSNGNLATPVVSMELVTPSGEIMTIDRNHPDFYGVVVGLGAFGIVTKITLEIEEAYDVTQNVFMDLPLNELVENFDDIMSAGYSVSLFTDWMDEKISEVWVKRRVKSESTNLEDNFYGATAATKNVHPIISLSAESCSEQLGIPGPWYNRLPHFKMGFTPSAGEELQSEFFIPHHNAVEAILALEKLKNEINPHLMITEVRTIAADDFWMSPCFHQNSVAIHFTWKQKPKEVMAVIPKIEATLEPYNVKPHWGKLFTLDPSTLHGRYEKFPEFLALAQKYDPEGKFRNDYLDLNIY